MAVSYRSAVWTKNPEQRCVWLDRLTLACELQAVIRVALMME